ncbi:MAG: RIP metalloprotease RseP [Firmicutes bacterium]|nr:RIP metalloprotease RseP [Bacillota bacterium]
MLTAVAVIFVFSLLVLGHEAGHLAAAKRAGVKVHEFSMGFGPRLWGTKWGDTVYNIRILPLGGFVRMAGMDDDDRESEGSFYRKTVGQRIGITVAGPLMNLLLAVVIFVMVFTVIGEPRYLNENRVGEVVEGTPAYSAGLRPGDRIVTVDSIPTASWETVQGQIRSKGANPIQLGIDREGTIVNLQVTPELKETNYQIGILPTSVIERQGIVSAVSTGFKYTYYITALILKSFMHINPDEMAGPVGIVYMIGQASKNGIYVLLQFAGMLSINLAILNLIPIPALDGSRVVFLLLEKLRGRPVDPEREGMIHLIGFALLMGLVLILTYKDIIRLFGNGT